MLHNMLMDPALKFAVISKGFKVIKEVYSRCQLVAANRENCKWIKRNLKLLNEVASELNKDGISVAYRDVLYYYIQSLY